MPVVSGVTRNSLPKSSTIPKGTYRFRVAKVGFKDVAYFEDLAKKNGKENKMKDDVIELDLVVMDEGEFLGRHVFDSLPTSGSFANRLRKFLDAIDYPEEQDLNTDDLVNAEFMGVVSVQAAQGDYDERNRVKKFININEYDGEAEEGAQSLLDEE